MIRSRWTSVWTKYPNGWKRHAFQNTYINAEADRCAVAAAQKYIGAHSGALVTGAMIRRLI